MDERLPLPSPLPDDPDREAILARRRRFLAAALSGVALVGCSSSVAVCLSIRADTGVEESPQPCLGAPLDDAGEDTTPTACLRIAPDAGPDAGPDADAGPVPCLEAPLDAGPDEDTAPVPCLDTAWEDAGMDGDTAPVPCLDVAPDR